MFVRVSLLALVSIGLAGCATFADTPDALLDAQYEKSKPYCYELDRTAVAASVASYLRACYTAAETTLVAGGVLIPVRANFTMKEEALPSGSRYSIRTSRGYSFGVDVKEGSTQCKTSLQMYAINFGWARSFERIDNHVRGAKIDCPM